MKIMGSEPGEPEPGIDVDAVFDHDRIAAALAEVERDPGPVSLWGADLFEQWRGKENPG